MNLGMGDHLKIMAMQHEGYGAAEIAAAIGCSIRTVRRAVNPSWWQEHRMAPLDKLQPRPKPAPAKLPPDMGRSYLPRSERHIRTLDIPPEVLAERDAFMEYQGDLTAEQLGDPPPWRSALGRRK